MQRQSIVATASPTMGCHQEATERVGLDETFEGHLVRPSAVGRDIFH